ncbi:MAG TPA: T9SS type A sorting domain-containing protein, partial [Bacteroidia bacterium]|nr:T9SS type A sorting domain-containing protein [Bacteroidia bacterium]
DNSYNVVDRFWVIDANGVYYNNGVKENYSVVPDPQLTFTYLNHTNASSEVSGLNNSIDNLLIAQRFDTIRNTWSDYLGPTGTTVINGNVSTVQTNNSPDIYSGGFFRSWTLASSENPLPIELTSFTAECQNFSAILQWTVSSQRNNDYFTIEKTSDGIHYTTVAVVKGAGNSSNSITYSAIDDNPLTGVTYYRISQTDYDGTTTNLNTVVYQPCENEATENAFVFNFNSINVQINSLINDNYTITLLSVLGQPVLTESRSVAIGNNTFILNTNVSDGIYILNIRNDNVNYIKRLYIGR